MQIAIVSTPSGRSHRTHLGTAIPKWVNSSFYSKTHDKPFRKDRFVSRCKMYEIQMLGILDHNLTTVTVPLLDHSGTSKFSQTLSKGDRKLIRDDFDAAIFGGKPGSDAEGLTEDVQTTENSLPVPSSYVSALLLAQKLEAKEKHSPVGNLATQARSLQPTQGRRIASATLSSASRVPDALPVQSLDLQRNPLRSVSPAASSLSLGRTDRTTSPSRSSEPSVDQPSEISTPEVFRAMRLNTQARQNTSVNRRIPSNWLFGAFQQRSQPSFPAARVEAVSRHDVSTSEALRAPLSLPVGLAGSSIQSRAVPSAPVITPSTPSPSKEQRITQPLPIVSRAARPTFTEDVARSLRNSVKLGKSPVDSLWGKTNAYQRGKAHVSLNPCNPKENVEISLGRDRRWQHVRPKPMQDSQHVVKWDSMCAPACLPLTTDDMPSPNEIQDLYEINSYDIACYLDQVSLLIRSDAAHVNLPLAVMQEMASQRLSRESGLIT